MSPTLEAEFELFDAGARYVVGVDEVGRGAIAGPVAVGMVVIDRAVGPHPEGLRDSKLLAEHTRERLAPLCAAWGVHAAVGQSSPAEIDAHGIVAALGVAGRRALAQLHAAGAELGDAVVLLDGNQDWLSPALGQRMSVTTRVKADLSCSSVAAASVVAKVRRDRIMIRLHETFPGYGWASNKGYGSAAHRAAVAELGATAHHRLTWLRQPA